MFHQLQFPTYDDHLIDKTKVVACISGFGATVDCELVQLPDTTSDEYAETQLNINARKTVDFILPKLQAAGANRILDVGCGMGTMVTTLCKTGLDAYGVDLAGLHSRWQQQQLDPHRFFIVGPDELVLPFRDRSLDFAFSLGVIEHVGTTDGHTDRLPNYHQIRKQWTREVFRTIKIGGHMLLGGPNRGFPIDVAHGQDSRASVVERGLSRLAGVSVHRTWGQHFLWGYRDVPTYLDGYSYELTPLSVKEYLYLSRVPKLVRPVVKAYLETLPAVLLGTWFNPWMAALVRRTA
jgi:SAM-dependent methyltransferase